MALLVVCRYIYYVVVIAATTINKNNKDFGYSFEPRELIPSLVSELMFTTLVLVHKYQASRLVSNEKDLGENKVLQK